MCNYNFFWGGCFSNCRKTGKIAFGEPFGVPHCVTNDMNCFYDGVPSLRCATFGMIDVR